MTNRGLGLMGSFRTPLSGMVIKKSERYIALLEKFFNIFFSKNPRDQFKKNCIRDHLSQVTPSHSNYTASNNILSRIMKERGIP